MNYTTQPQQNSTSRPKNSQRNTNTLKQFSPLNYSEDLLEEPKPEKHKPTKHFKPTTNNYYLNFKSLVVPQSISICATDRSQFDSSCSNNDPYYTNTNRSSSFLYHQQDPVSQMPPAAKSLSTIKQSQSSQLLQKKPTDFPFFLPKHTKLPLEFLQQKQTNSRQLAFTNHSVHFNASSDQMKIKCQKNNQDRSLVQQGQQQQQQQQQQKKEQQQEGSMVETYSSLQQYSNSDRTIKNLFNPIDQPKQLLPIKNNQIKDSSQFQQKQPLQPINSEFLSRPSKNNQKSQKLSLPSIFSSQKILKPHKYTTSVAVKGNDEVQGVVEEQSTSKKKEQSVINWGLNNLPANEFQDKLININNANSSIANDTSTACKINQAIVKQKSLYWFNQKQGNTGFQNFQNLASSTKNMLGKQKYSKNDMALRNPDFQSDCISPSKSLTDRTANPDALSNRSDGNILILNRSSSSQQTPAQQVNPFMASSNVDYSSSQNSQSYQYAYQDSHRQFLQSDIMNQNQHSEHNQTAIADYKRKIWNKILLQRQRNQIQNGQMNTISIPKNDDQNNLNNSTKYQDESVKSFHVRLPTFSAYLSSPLQCSVEPSNKEIIIDYPQQFNKSPSLQNSSLKTFKKNPVMLEQGNAVSKMVAEKKQKQADGEDDKYFNIDTMALTGGFGIPQK